MNNYFKGFLTGSAIGTIAGMIIIPMVNPDARNKMMNKGKKMVNDYKEKMTGCPEENV